MKSSQTAVDVVVQGNPTLSKVTPDGLIEIGGFRNEVIAIAKRGAATIQTMEKSGYSPDRIEKERLELRRDVLAVRLKVSSQFQEVITGIIRDAGLQ
jgi:hypothetical protein